MHELRVFICFAEDQIARLPQRKPRPFGRRAFLLKDQPEIEPQGICRGLLVSTLLQSSLKDLRLCGLLPKLIECFDIECDFFFFAYGPFNIK
jgi:hypothetical protein